MTPEQVARGRRAVACLGWRWMPGMLGCLASNPKSTIRIVHAGGGLLYHANGGVWSDDGVFPVLEDPATLGCLVALVRKLHGDALWSSPERGGAKGGHWRVWRDKSGGPSPMAYGDTEADAWLAALEAAGRR